MNKIQQTIKEFLEKYNLNNPENTYLCAFSGGYDSMCLLHSLKQITPQNRIVALHLNHNWRGEESNQEEENCRNFCKEIGVEFYSEKLSSDIPHTETAAREARYEFFEEIYSKVEANKIAIAHNKNDKAETIIMHLLRGSGLSGLKGIEPIRDNKYIRPLIECERSEIEKYCDENNLNPRIDKTNFENEYTRNKIRNIVIPYIKKEFNPNIVETLDRLSEVATDESNYINRQVQNTYNKLLVEKTEKQIILKWKEFNLQEKIIKSRLILYTIKELMGSTEGIEKIHIESIIKLCDNNIGNKYLTPNKKIKIFVNDKKIFFIAQV